MPCLPVKGEGAVRPPVEAGTRRGDSDISLNAVGIPRPLGRGGCQKQIEFD